MKKKLLAGLLSLLMIFTMASGVLGVVTTTLPGVSQTGHGTHTSPTVSQTMFDECPKCGFDYAVFYVSEGNLKYACPECRATGTAVVGGTGTNRPGTSAACVCGKTCICTFNCSCGKVVHCGRNCIGCYKYYACSADCASCEKPVICDSCNTSRCDCSVTCACGRPGSCGEYCVICGTYMSCADDCKSCGRTSSGCRPNVPGLPGTTVKPDTSYKHECGKNCTCDVVCSKCKKVAGICGEYCRLCGTYLTCAKDCKSCYDEYNWDYKVVVTKTAGGSYSISGGEYGRRGETKTLYIYTYDDYAIANVSINGINYGSDYSKFTLEMNRSYNVKITFKKVNTNILYTVTSDALGEGTIVLQKNGTKVTGSSVKVNYNDILSCRFVPEENYAVKDVKVNGKSVGAKDSYILENLRTNVTISVEFAWDSPYTDVADAHEDAVAYVTKADLMGSFYTYIHTDLFKGDKLVSIKTLAAALAEMADTKETLNKDADRIKWMTDNGVLAEDADLKAIATVETACELIAKYLEVLEDKNNISFKGDKDSNTAKETCIALDLITEKAYKANAKVTRYDMAELLYAISELEYTK